jgi:tetratricopeptide (TPR) repeat protein
MNTLVRIAMRTRWSSSALLGALCALCALATPAAAQTLQYRSPAGVAYRSQKDTGAVARAAQALAADPKNVDKIIALGTAQASVRDMRGALATFTKGLAAHPNNALLYRWRGHRHLSVREFAAAKADFARGLAIDSAVYGLWYHLGIVRFVEGKFGDAAAAFTRAQPLAPDAGELAGSTDWLWMSLARAGRLVEAKAMLDRKPDSLTVHDPEYAYVKRLRLYRGAVGPEQLITTSDTADVQVATLSFGLGNWYLVQGDTAKAKAAFERAVKSGGWPGFGFIVSEVELRRMHAAPHATPHAAPPRTPRAPSAG